MDENRRDKAGSKTTAVEDVKWVFNGKSKLWMPKHKKTGGFRRGFKDKTIWDWMQLLIIPIVLAAVSFGLGLEQSRISDANSQRQHETDIQIAATRYANDQQITADQQQEATLKTYLDDMSDLLLNHNLRKSKPGDEVSQVARERTLTTLRRLGADRNRIVLQFLQDAYLLGALGVKDPVIDLRNANLSYDNLRRVPLFDIDLSGVDLRGADLSYADLAVTSLKGAILRGADLSYADLSGASLRGANLSGALVSQEQLAQAESLAGATMPDGSVHP